MPDRQGEEVCEADLTEKIHETGKLFDVKLRGSKEEVAFLMDHYLAAVAKHFPGAVLKGMAFDPEKKPDAVPLSE